MPSKCHQPHTGLHKSHHHTINHQQQARRKKEEGRVVAQSNKCTRPQKQANTMATWLAALVLSKCHQSWSPQPHTTIHNHNQCVWFWRKHRDSLTTATNHGHHTLPSPWCGLAVLCVCVSQMASVWHHGHSVATSIKPPLMPHTHRERERERGVDGARKTVEGEGTADGVEMVGQTSESQAPQQ